MGNGSYLRSSWVEYSTSKNLDTLTEQQVTNRIAVVSDFLPNNFKNGIRESRDSADNPASTPLVVAGDVTGSMGLLAGRLIKGGLQRFAEEIYERKPVTNPHIMGMAVDDVDYCNTPVQATQFEADLRILQQFEQLYITGAGGGNDYESYNLPWIVAARMVAHDAWEKRGQKGVLFTYGDECVPGPLSRAQIKAVLGIDVQVERLAAEDALRMAQERWDVYHLVIEEGGYAKANLAKVSNGWRELLGENVQNVDDSTKLAEVMVSILQLRAGEDADIVAKSWGGASGSVMRALESRGRRYVL